MTFRRIALSVWALALGSSQAVGAGLELNQHGVKETSHAFAGSAALLEDASAIAHNPAGLTRLEGNQFSGGLTALYADIDYSAEFQREKVEKRKGVEPRAIEGSGNASSNAITPIPHLYYSHAVNDQTALGIGIYAPFGSGSDYEEGWQGRYHAEETEQSAVNINPTIATELSDELSVGLGVVIQAYEATLTNQIDVAYLVAESFLEQSDTEDEGNVNEVLDRADDARAEAGDVINEVEIDSIGYGFSFGLLWEPREDTRIGLNYRSRVEHLAEGEAERPNLEEIGEAVETTLKDFGADEQAEAAREQATGKLGAAGGDLSSNITFPEIAELSVHHELTERLAVMGSIAYTNWSVFDEIRLEYDIDPAAETADAGDTDAPTRGGEDLAGEDLKRRDLVQPLNFEDSWRFGVGASYQWDDQLALRTGFSFDESPLKDAENRTPRGPDSDRFIVGLGASFQVDEQLSVDLGYAYTRIGMEWRDGLPRSTRADVEPRENPAGTLHRGEGSTRTNLHSLGLQASYDF